MKKYIKFQMIFLCFFITNSGEYSLVPKEKKIVSIRLKIKKHINENNYLYIIFAGIIFSSTILYHYFILPGQTKISASKPNVDEQSEHDNQKKNSKDANTIFNASDDNSQMTPSINNTVHNSNDEINTQIPIATDTKDIPQEKIEQSPEISNTSVLAEQQINNTSDILQINDSPLNNVKNNPDNPSDHQNTSSEPKTNPVNQINQDSSSSNDENIRAYYKNCIENTPAFKNLSKTQQAVLLEQLMDKHKSGNRDTITIKSDKKTEKSDQKKRWSWF